MGIVVFDWSGTLCDNNAPFYLTVRRMFEQWGKPAPSKDWLRDNWTTPYMNFWRKHLPGITDEQQRALYTRCIADTGETRLYAGVEAALATMHAERLEMHVISSDLQARLQEEVNRFGVGQYFGSITADVHDKAPALTALVRQSWSRPSALTYIGDVDGDIRAGKQAYVRTIGITWGCQSRAVLERAKPDALIDDISELPGLVIP